MKKGGVFNFKIKFENEVIDDFKTNDIKSAKKRFKCIWDKFK